MHNDDIFPTFTHQQQLQYSLTCVLNTNQHSLSFSLFVPTDTFPKIYFKILAESQVTQQMKLIFDNLLGLYKAIKEKQNIEVIEHSGIIRLKYTIKIGNEDKIKYIDLKLDRALDNQLDQIRKIINDKVKQIGGAQEIERRIQKLWRRTEDNEKIYLKFKQQMQSRVQQLTERMNIQNTKIAIVRQDVSKLHLSFQKLTAIVCPIFSKININSDHTNHFILQDRKIMYTGESGVWTQILFKNQIIINRKCQVSFKIVNTKKSNIIAGITCANQLNFRSSAHSGKGQKIEKKFLGYSGTGHFYSSDTSEQILSNILLVPHHQSAKQRSKSNQKAYSSHEISSITSSTIQSPKLLQSSKAHQSEAFKPMQIIKMTIELEKDKINWRNGSKLLMQSRIGPEFKNQSLVPFFEFCDTGDAIEFVDI